MFIDGKIHYLKEFGRQYLNPSIDEGMLNQKYEFFQHFTGKKDKEF